MNNQEFYEALTLRREVNDIGTVRWYNSEGQLHRTDGPAIEWLDGTKYWYVNGRCHRTDGPAMEFADGHNAWFLNGEQVEPF